MMWGGGCGLRKIASKVLIYKSIGLDGSGKKRN
jgi:hypothetical protein